MKFPILFICASIVFCGCKERPAVKAVPPAVAEEMTSRKVDDTALPEPLDASAAANATPEQIASTVRVRVIVGGLPPRNYTGALLHRDELTEFPAMQGKNRCVLALLRGWSAAQLQSSDARLFVIRNRPGSQGEYRAVTYPARFLQIDEQTGVAALSYAERFNAESEAGYHLQRQPFAGKWTNVVRTFSAPAPALAEATPPQQPEPRPPFDQRQPYDPRQMPRPSPQAPAPPLAIEAGRFTADSGQQGTLRFPPAVGEAKGDEAPLAVAPPATLIAFAGEAGERIALTPIRDFQLTWKAPMLKPTGIGFGDANGGRLPIAVTVELDNTGPAPKAILLGVAESPGDAAAAEIMAKPPSSPIELTRSIRLQAATGETTIWKGDLTAPTKDGEELDFVLQIGWPAFPNEYEASIYSRAFRVKLRRQEGRVVPVVTGLANLNEATAGAKTEVAKFPLESGVRDLHEIAGGREVLMQLDGPPFWKRFSLTRNEWLPLPAGNLANTCVTGNLNAIFVLDRGAAEIRKFDLADLHPVASIKLPSGSEYVAIVAGCNSERGPLHVVTKDDTFALAADTLQRRDLTFAANTIHRRLELKVSTDDRFQVTGDGLSFLPCKGLGEFAGATLRYNSDALGTVRKFLDADSGGSIECGRAVSGAYSMTRDTWLNSVARLNGERIITPTPAIKPGVYPHWLAPNSPIIFRLLPVDPNAIPGRPPRIEFFSYFDATPFAEVDVPERSGDPNGVFVTELTRWSAFDPFSLRLGVLALDRKVWMVHQVVPSPNRAQPVLLNWPDSSLTRGSAFRFRPLLLGGDKFTAELIGQKGAVVAKSENGEVSFPIAADELASLMLLTLKVPGKEGELTYPIPLHVFGTQLPFVTRQGDFPQVGNFFAAGFKSLAASKTEAQVLPATVQVMRNPVQQVLGPVAGHLILISTQGIGTLTGSRVETFSLKTKAVAATLNSPARAAYYAGAEGLFEYDPVARSLARLSVPDLRRVCAMTLPNGLRLHALAVGTVAGSPLTLLLEQIQGQTTGQLGDLSITTTRFDRNVVVLDSRTLQGGGWAQPRLFSENGTPDFGSNPYNIGGITDTPKLLPSAHNGQFVTLPQIFLALGRGLSLAARFPAAKNMLLLDNGLYPPTGSISGMVVANSMGTVFHAGISDNFNQQNQPSLCVTPCGRYRLARVNGNFNSGDAIDIRTIENNVPLFRLGRLSTFRPEFEGFNEQVRQRVLVLGDNGPLVVLSGGGKLLEIVDLDIPRLAKQLSSAAFHVTSQPAACMADGAVLEYQIEVNNLDAVASYRLRNETAGATLSPKGLLRFAPPQQVAAPTRITISTEIVGKDGQTVLYEFPLLILPARTPASPPPANPTAPRKTI